MRRVLILAVLIGPVVALAADGPIVVQANKQFNAQTLSVARGTVVTFVNDDDFRHNLSVRTPSGEVRSGTVQNPGDRTGIVFDESGPYRVTCLIHPQMRMTIDVK